MSAPEAGDAPRKEPFSVLFVCTGNSCRSIMAESLLAHHGGDRIIARSAGSHPTGFIHPLSLRALAELGIDASAARSQSWDHIEGRIDAVLTVCDAAAGETCPWFQGPAIQAHWGVRDPAAFRGSEEATLACFRNVRDQLEVRVKAMLDLPLERLGHSDLERELSLIGRL